MLAIFFDEMHYSHRTSSPEVSSRFDTCLKITSLRISICSFRTWKVRFAFPSAVVLCFVHKGKVLLVRKLPKVDLGCGG